MSDVVDSSWTLPASSLPSSLLVPFESSLHEARAISHVLKRKTIKAARQRPTIVLPKQSKNIKVDRRKSYNMSLKIIS